MPGEFRAMRRIRQQLTDEECERILAEGMRGTLAVAGEGGYPYAVPLNYTYEAGRLTFHGAQEGHKMDALATCDKASFCVIGEPTREEGQWWNDVRSVICFGRIRRVENRDLIERALREIAGKYWPEGMDPADEVAKTIDHVAILLLEIEHMTGKRIREK